MKPTSPERPDGAEKRYKLYELSTEENYAYRYTLAVLDPEHHKKNWEVLNARADQLAVMKRLHVSSAQEKRQAVAIGLARLAEKGLVLLEKNGEGLWEPVHFRTELLDTDGMGSSFILGDGN